MKLRFGLATLMLASVVALASANAGDRYYEVDVGGYWYTGKDNPAFAPVVWNGFYGGLNGGWAWSENSDQLAFPASGFRGVSPSGGFAGGQIGYNWQGVWHPYLVLGVETDLQGAGIDDKGFDRFGDVFKSQLDFFGTIRGRIGYTTDRSLVYFTGGFAYGEINNKANFSSTLGPVFGKDVISTGYVLGGGWEYNISPVWSVKAEYQYINLGKNEPEFIGVPFSAVTGVVHDDAFHTVRAGVNYHLIPRYEPLEPPLK